MPDPASIPTRPLNAYKVLGIAPDADQLAIQVAYRTLAKQFHPDRNGSPLGRRLMLVVNEAYDAVKTSERRAAYDAALRRQRLDGRPMPIEEQRPRPEAAPRSAASPAPAPVEVQDLGPLHRRAQSLHAARHPDGARVLEFGRYAGHTIDQVARIDRDWLEWFIRTPLGRPFTREVLAALG
jgi:curved DNA-binding protein CbpA